MSGIGQICSVKGSHATIGNGNDMAPVRRPEIKPKPRVQKENKNKTKMSYGHTSVYTDILLQRLNNFMGLNAKDIVGCAWWKNGRNQWIQDSIWNCKPSGVKIGGTTQPETKDDSQMYKHIRHIHHIVVSASYINMLGTVYEQCTFTDILTTLYDRQSCTMKKG